MHKLVLISLMLFATTGLAQNIVVTSPGSGSVRIAEGRDFATYEIGDPWDMSNSQDVVLRYSRDIAGETFAGGIYSGTSVTTDPRIWLLYPGLQNAVRVLDNGEKFPIKTNIYRYLSMKIRFTGTTDKQTIVAYFYPNASSQSSNSFGLVSIPLVASGVWQTVSVDLVTDADTNRLQWTASPEVRGLRIDPVNKAGVTFEIDWVRLSAQPQAGVDNFVVTWSGGSAPYTVAAIDNAGNEYRFTQPEPIENNPVSASPYTAPFSLLPPGNYQLRVSDGVRSGASSGVVSVNEAPIFNFVEPDIMGDVANSYAVVETGNPWGPMDAGDVQSTPDLINVRYNNPVGSLKAETTTSDPRILFNTPIPIDTQKYRVITYTYELLPDTNGNPDDSSIARVLFGNNLTSLTTSEDIIIHPGTNTYPLGDMRQLRLEPGETGSWTGSLAFLRFDPHEIGGQGDTRDPHRTIRLDSFILAPFDTATTDFVFRWTDSDSDDNAFISLFADTDENPNNGNETALVSGLRENNANLTTWSVTLPQGLYRIFARISDGLNETVRYATGPLAIAGANGSIFVDGFEN